MVLSSSTDTNQGLSQQYPYPSHVNAASFLSVKLSGKGNYARWREQMMCLLDSHDMLGFIDGTITKPQKNNGIEAKHREWKRSDTLVKGWISGSLSEDVMETVVGLQTAIDVWNKLKTNYTIPDPPRAPAPPAIAARRKDVGEYIPLYRAIQMGDWEKAQEFFNHDKNALIDKLNDWGFTALHKNALHWAASLGNSLATKKLVEKNPHLLFMVYNVEYLPIEGAAVNSHKTTFLYLFEMCKQHIGLSQKKGCHNPFVGRRGVRLLANTISSGFLEAAYDLLRDYPELAATEVATFKPPLWNIAGKMDAYLSAKRYNFYQRFIYSHVPI